MKKSILIILFFVTATRCKSQIQTISLSTQNHQLSINGAYYQDTENDFTPFLGEWQFDNGDKFIKIELKKITRYHNQYSPHNYFEDLIIGEYLYKENEIEKVNTLNLLMNTLVSPYKFNIVGNLILHKNGIPPCADCQPTEKRLSLMFDDPTRNVLGLRGNIELRRVDENGVQKLKMTLRETGNIILEDGMMPEFTSFNLPWGTYILTRP